MSIAFGSKAERIERRRPCVHRLERQLFCGLQDAGAHPLSAPNSARFWSAVAPYSFPPRRSPSPKQHPHGTDVRLTKRLRATALQDAVAQPLKRPLLRQVMECCSPYSFPPRRSPSPKPHPHGADVRPTKRRRSAALQDAVAQSITLPGIARPRSLVTLHGFSAKTIFDARRK